MDTPNVRDHDHPPDISGIKNRKYKHIKRGTEYTVLDRVWSSDKEEWQILYLGKMTCEYYVRSFEEFFDGRFQEVGNPWAK